VGFKLISVANWLLQCFDTVGWVIWPVKIVPEMTYSVEWDVKPLLTDSLANNNNNSNSNNNLYL